MIYIIPILFIIPILVLYLYYETTEAKLERISISSDNIKGNLKILHLSDHHFKKTGKLEKKIISHLQKEDFDIIVLTGDYLRNITDINDFAVFLKRLNLNQPAFAVSGDNDYSINPILWQEFFKESRITFLANQGLSIDIAENRINIIGVECPGIARYYVFVCIIMLLLLSIGTVYAHEVNFEYETKISDYGLYFDGEQVTGNARHTRPDRDDGRYDYAFGRRITPHGDCIAKHGDYVFVTWYRGGKSLNLGD